MNGIGTIYYVIPNIQEKDYNPINLAKAVVRGEGGRHLKRYWYSRHKPVGGIKVIFQHCLILQALGYDAVPLQMGNYSGNFFGYPIEPRRIENVGYKLQQNDVVVIPEFVPNLGSRFECGTKILFAQNWCHLYRESDVPDGDTSYIDMGFDHIFICSNFIKDKLCREPAERIHLINNYLDFSRFRPDAATRRTGRIMALPRKKPEDLRGIMSLLAEKNYEFRLVDGVSEAEIIAEYQQADIFLATGYPEGFGLPPLEAMACGATVVGFSGGGASEYMIDRETAIVAEDGDVEAAAQGLMRLLEDIELKERLRTSGTEIAANYTQNRTTAQIADFFGALSL